MTVIGIIVLALGAAFAAFGYFIYFKNRYHLINGFEADFRSGKKDARYARRVGKVEFVLGLSLMAAGLLLLLL